MTEEYARDRWFDKISPARELRGAVQAFWFIGATREKPDVRYGWDVGTCIRQYDELDAIGRLGLRTAPLLVGLAVAFFVAQANLRWPTGLLWIPVAYLWGTWLLFTFYDSLAGLYLLATGEDDRPSEVSS